MFAAIDGALAAARAQGVRDVEVYAERSRSRRIRVFRQEVEELTAAARRGVGVRVFRGGVVGHAYSSDIGAEALADVVRRAADNAAVGDPDGFTSIPEPGGPFADVRLYDERLTAAVDARRIEMALGVERAALAADPRVKMVEDAIYADVDGEVFIGSSAGVRGSYRVGQCYVYAYVLAEQDGRVETGRAYTVGRALEDLEVDVCGREAAGRACRLLGARRCPSLRAPVILDPFVAAAFLGVVSAALAADAVQKGRSLFAGKEGQQVAGEILRLEDDGTRADGLNTAPFDGEGMPGQRTGLIGAGGVLEGFLYDTRTARKAGRCSTGNGLRSSYTGLPGVRPTNLVVAGPTTPLDAIVAGIERGVLVTDAAGVHSGANPVSGEFSVGIAGILIESGAFTRPVHEMTMAGDILGMLNNVCALGDDARWVPAGSIHTPSLLIDGMSISGT